MTWCKDIVRDAAVRAAEDGRDRPLPTLEEAIASPFAEAAERSSTVSETGETQSGIRTERVTLECVHRFGKPPREWDWWRLMELRPGESVRVVEEPSSDLDSEVLRRALVASEMRRLREERRWVPVGERLPEEDVHVLAWHSGDECPRVAYRTYGIWKTVAFNHSDDASIVVTHWQPLPPGPDGEP